MPQRDYYEVLGVARNATPDEIKQAFRKLARRHHPDANPGDPTAEERFKELSGAYEVLSDPEKRARYDQLGSPEAFQQAGNGAGFGGFDFGGAQGFGGFDDLFEMFLGNAGGARRRGPVGGPDLRADLILTLEEVLSGVDRSVEVDREEVCDVCNGTGGEGSGAVEPCRDCRGTGTVQQVRESILGSFVRTGPCPRCRGTGRIIKKPCRRCQGHGRVRRTRNLSVHVPPGVDNGTRLRVQGQGGAGERGGPPGDLMVFVHVKDHARFQRQGSDLSTDLKVGMAQAALGADLELETLEGKRIPVKVPPGTQPGTILRLNDHGLPRLGQSGRGALKVQVVLDVPKKLTAREQELLRQWAELRGESVAGEKGFMKRMRDALG